jgi:hypothetical protein
MSATSDEANQEASPVGATSDLRRKGRYVHSVDERHPMISPGNLLSFSNQRPGRFITARDNGDLHANTAFGDPVIFKASTSIRFLFQNVKGLTYSSSNEDYKYYMQGMSSYSVDVFGMAETNTNWQHPHLQLDFKDNVRKQFRYGKTVFGHPSKEVDPSSTSSNFQAGGTVQVVQGRLTTTSHRKTICDPSGMGRWCGMTYEGKGRRKLSVITGYRVCASSISSAPIGSAFHREYAFLRHQGSPHPNPRQSFIDDMTILIRHFQEEEHAILFMLDANSTLDSDRRFKEFISSLDLHDLHASHPAPSTYIGAPDRRIDYMFGCARTLDAMTRQGSLSYFEGPQSDHRSLYVDINLDKLFGSATLAAPIGSSETRALRSGNPEHVIAYNAAMHRYYEQHNMQSRIDQLYANHHVMSRKEVRKVLESWDSDQGRAMKAAESALRIPPKPYKWSPKLRNAGVQYRYWRLRLREIQHNEDYSNTFARWVRQMQEHEPTFSLPDQGVALDTATVKKRLNESNQLLRKLQASSTDLRLKSYHDLLATYDADTDSRTIPESRRKARIVHRTILSEASKRMYGILRAIVNPSEYSPLSKLQIPRPSSSPATTEPGKVHQVLQETAPENILWDTIIDKQDIESHLLSFNREAFRAAAESPCGHGLIHDALTYTSLSPEAEALLLGEVPPDWYGDNVLLREFLASFQIPDSVMAADPIPIEVTAEDLTKGFKTWRESTSTSPSGRHLGHYKALIQDPILLDSLRKFLNIAICRGISVQRWSKAVNVMIEKDPGKPRLNRLRIIHLFEADYNLFLKLLWGSRLVRRAVNFNLLNDGQHGSVPGRTTMDPIMLNQLTTDLCRLLKINYARFDNDASACYDRIIVALAMLAARRCGMPLNAISSHAKALLFMQYTVKTIYGISEESYQGTPFTPLFGTGQGSGASPAVWLSLVVLLLNTLERVTPSRISFRSPDGTLDHRRLVDAFVDDTAIGITDSGDKSLPDLVKSLEDVAQTWEQLLHFSGGALNLKKCSWYVMYWDWRNGRPVLRPHQAADPEVQLRQGNSDDTTPIQRQSLTTASRVLGVHQTPMGDFSVHIQSMKTKADTYAGYLKSPRLTPSDIRVFHNTIYGPAMRYSLPAIAVDEEELEHVQTKIIPTILQRIGFSSKTPTAVRHGPRSMGGIGLIDLRTEGGIEMIKFFRHAVYSDSQVGRLLLLQLQASQLESGLPNLLLEEPKLLIPYLTPTWILSMRQYLSNHNITITVTGAEPAPLKSPSDQHIMCLEKLTILDNRGKTDLNLVRIYLQVATLADISDNSDRTKIATWALNATRPSDFSDQSHWPRQAPPSPFQRRIWRKYIESHFLRYGRTWKTAPYPRQHGRDHHNEATPDSADTAEDILPRLMKQLPRHQRRLLSHVRQVATDDTMQQIDSQAPALTISSDGGLKGHLGTFGWQLSTNDNVVLYEGAGPVDGPYDSASSTRSELAGYVAPLILLALISNKFGDIPSSGFRWVTDSKGAIANVKSSTPSPGYMQRQPNNVDFLATIQELSKSLNRPLESIWIKGHQSLATLPDGANHHDVERNNKADELATWYREQTTRSQSSEMVDHVPASRVSISINGRRLVGNIESSIRYHINGTYLRSYMQSKNAWSDRTWESIDRESFGIFYCKLSQTEQDYCTKALFNQLHVGTNRYKTATIKDPNLKICPCCTADIETMTHLFRCKSNPARDETIRMLLKALTPTAPHPAQYALKAGILRWLDGDDSPLVGMPVDEFPTKFHASLLKAIADQNSIGWGHAMNGHLSVEWKYLLSHDMYDSNTTQEGRGPYHIRLILKAILQSSRSLWLSRNGALHGETTDALDRIRSAERAEITEYYQQPELISAGDRHYCKQPLAELLKKNPSTRRRWLRYMRMARQRFVANSAGQTRITSFFRHLNG